ncbi:Nramp family divalent metal transporter [Altibacter sp.]|uniref:Nramp family divalent metal transporter n=1 Tax=Altibacter sp. TaxID=2024823 RepID=UPI000C92D8A0|nr:Nramp family divalent metal transporter [Altibacter sp.]MAP54929.1 manganese transporter [Altibacter sp.]
MIQRFKNIGPGTLVAAAFIGPGTVTVCTLAGVQFGFTLLWAMALSIIATIVLQEMAARLGLVSGSGLAENIRKEIKHPVAKGLAILLMLSAILIGNAAYEAGNISGGVLGLQTIFEQYTLLFAGMEVNLLSVGIGALAFVLLYIGNYKVIERSLIILVLLMSVSFLITAVRTVPNVLEILQGIFIPKVPEEGWLTIIALVGTTVVPYNLFLHASLVKEKWNGVGDLGAARKDLYVSILLGGLVSMAIIISAAAIQQSEVSNASDLAQSLAPLFGSFATYFLSIGLFAAGITSAITAPLAAAYVVKGCFGWQAGLRSLGFRAVWMSVLGLGIVFSSLGIKPIEIIQFAQVANGILLPVIAIFLLWVVNRKTVMGANRNTVVQNLLGFFIVLTSILLGVKSLAKVFEIL